MPRNFLLSNTMWWRIRAQYNRLLTLSRKKHMCLLLITWKYMYSTCWYVQNQGTPNYTTRNWSAAAARGITSLLFSSSAGHKGEKNSVQFSQQKKNLTRPSLQWVINADIAADEPCLPVAQGVVIFGSQEEEEEAAKSSIVNNACYRWCQGIITFYAAAQWQLL